MPPAHELSPPINYNGDGFLKPPSATNDLLFNERLHEPLDPFIRLAGNLSLQDRNLLHHYLVEGPAKFYGIKSGALYCPWTLLSAEMSALGPVLAETSVSFLARRARTYRAMNRSISDPKTRTSDYTIIGITMAGLIEGRLNNALSARMHMAAVRALVRSRYILKGIPKQLNFATFCNCTRVGLGPYAFPDVTAFESALEDFVKVMAGMQQWILNVIDLLNTQARGQDCQVSLSLGRYILARVHAFSPSAPMHRFIGPVSYKQEEFDERAHVSNLWGINSILYELRDNLDEAAEFLETLHRYVESASEPSSTDRYASSANLEPFELKVTAMNSILGKVGTLCLKRPGEMVDGSGSFWWRTVDAVELLHLLSLASRGRLLQKLSGRLIGSEVPRVADFVSENELKDLADEMRQAWMAQQASNAPAPARGSSSDQSLTQYPFRQRSGARPVTFINHDAKHLEISSQDIRSINTHINSHKVASERKHTAYKEGSFLI